MKNHILLLLISMFLITACNLKSPGIPSDKMNYVGRWKSLSMELVITKDGSVQYERIEGGTSKSVSGPLQKFIGNDFEVGALGITTTFKVTNPPHEEEGVWKMTVDGEELKRVEE
ncbi:hypothetical protein [Solitalea canadensis]|uniref:Lipocalin-like domain-containing protein n=1 Tax=Solitalea canadensis (strain ATCC 29591 / DSM 3403 / JCM 21819 / LMG 8368 / NBRC 15130 / NCIMB 12057 / USAM 9D) TaxID=929556 RepID=H8KWM7_SOLCM|nr:hypothetical protein [Solitalea canadensis]AFD08206.1 hypothetical protein Solca_3195 [Solitalea canadensis DSM 3403]